MMMMTVLESPSATVFQQQQQWIDDTNNLTLACLASPTQSETLRLLGISLEGVQGLTPETAPTFRPIVSKKHRGLAWPITKGLLKQAAGVVPSPVMLTHIVTTRCNYSCPFCSFADSLNQKTNDLTLEEIDQIYATIGNSLNTIVYSGGETTVNSQLAEIIESAYVRTPVQSVYIISNAWKPERLIEITHQVLQRCPELHLTWSLSIEGPRAYNNSVRSTKAKNWDAWHNTIQTLFALKQLKETFGYTQLDVQLCTVCTPENHTLLPAWYRLVRDVLKPDKWNLNLMRRSVQMEGSALAIFHERRQQEGLEPFEQTYIEVTRQLRIDALQGRLGFNYHTGTPIEGAMKAATDLLSQEMNQRTLLQQPALVGCKAGLTGAYLSNTGLVGGCEEFVHNAQSPKAYGSVREANYDFMAVWHSEQANQWRQLTNCATECVGCTLESQRNYPAMLLSPRTLLQSYGLGKQLLQGAERFSPHTIVEHPTVPQVMAD